MRRLRNITVTVDERAAKWARLEAARQDTSVSRLLGKILEEMMGHDHKYEQAMRRAIARQPYLHSGGKYLTREEAHDRNRLR